MVCKAKRAPLILFLLLESRSLLFGIITAEIYRERMSACCPLYGSRPQTPRANGSPGCSSYLPPVSTASECSINRCSPALADCSRLHAKQIISVGWSLCLFMPCQWRNGSHQDSRRTLVCLFIAGWCVKLLHPSVCAFLPTGISLWVTAAAAGCAELLLPSLVTVFLQTAGERVCVCVRVCVQARPAGLVSELVKEASVMARRWSSPEGSDK